jgi:hypothetical protein
MARFPPNWREENSKLHAQVERLKADTGLDFAPMQLVHLKLCLYEMAQLGSKENCDDGSRGHIDEMLWTCIGIRLGELAEMVNRFPNRGECRPHIACAPCPA